MPRLNSQEGCRKAKQAVYSLDCTSSSPSPPAANLNDGLSSYPEADLRRKHYAVRVYLDVSPNWGGRGNHKSHERGANDASGAIPPPTFGTTTNRPCSIQNLRPSSLATTNFGKAVKYWPGAKQFVLIALLCLAPPLQLFYSTPTLMQFCLSFARFSPPFEVGDDIDDIDSL